MTPLNPPPRLVNLLVENPLPLMAALLLLGLGLLLTASKRKNSKRAMAAALTSLGLMIVVYFVAKGVTTTREVIMDQTRKLVAMTAPMDFSALQELIAPNCPVQGPDARTWVNAGAVVSTLKMVGQNHPITSQFVRSVDADVTADGLGGRSLLTVTSGVEGQTVPTTWLLTWHKNQTGEWRVVTIQWLLIRGQPPTPGILVQ